MRKRLITFAILISITTLITNGQCEATKTKLFHLNRDDSPTEATIFKRIARQTGYNYDRPKILFDLPSVVPVTPKPAPAPSPQPGSYVYPAPAPSPQPAPAPSPQPGSYAYPAPAPSPQPAPAPSPQPGSYAYPAPAPSPRPAPAPSPRPAPAPSPQPGSYAYPAPPSGTPAPPVVNTQGYDVAIPAAPQPDNSYNYKPPAPKGTPIDGGGGYPGNKPSEGEYSYNAPAGPSSVAPVIIISSTAAVSIPSTAEQSYLPPNVGPPSTSYGEPIDVRTSSSTPGEPYLPPKVGPPPAGPPPAGPPNQSYIPPSRGPLRRPPPNKSTPSVATPSGGPANIPNSYLAPSDGPAPSPPGGSYIPPSGNSPAPKARPPNNSYLAPTPTPFQTQTTSQRAQTFSTPAKSYLPPYK